MTEAPLFSDNQLKEHAFLAGPNDILFPSSLPYRSHAS
jgi:hypothetical protein